MSIDDKYSRRLGRVDRARDLAVSSTRARVATSVFDRDIGSTSVRGRFHASSTRVRDRGDARSIDILFVDAFARARRRSRRRVARRRSIELEGRKASKSVATRSTERHSTTRSSSSPLGARASASAKSKR